MLAMLTNPACHFKRIGLEAGPLSQWLFNALAGNVTVTRIALRFVAD